MRVSVISLLREFYQYKKTHLSFIPKPKKEKPCTTTHNSYPRTLSPTSLYCLREKSHKCFLHNLTLSNYFGAHLLQEIYTLSSSFSSPLSVGSLSWFLSSPQFIDNLFTFLSSLRNERRQPYAKRELLSSFPSLASIIISQKVNKDGCNLQREANLATAVFFLVHYAFPLIGGIVRSVIPTRSTTNHVLVWNFGTEGGVPAPIPPSRPLSRRSCEPCETKKMAPYFLLAFLICSISILFQSQKAAASIAMALPGCQDQCGEMVIPYPFGMKKGCYLDETFKVECNESTGSASLAWKHWEVDRISISTHTLRHKNVSVLTSKFDKSGESLNGHSFYLKLTSNHHSVSHTKNTFVAVGCDFYAYLIDDETREFQGGCASLCNRTDIRPLPSLSCSGLHCCQISLPKDLVNWTVGIETMNTLTKSWADQCGFFTFVDKDFLRQNKMNFSACNESYTVPMIHEWTVGETSCNIARERVDYACGQNTDCINHTPGMGYRCKCSNGYQGNPYLPGGCQDINECGNPKDNNCPMKNLCVNTAGSYFCLPNRGHMLALFVPLGTGLVVGLLILVAISLWVWQKLKEIKDRKMKQIFFKRNGGLLLQQQISTSGGRVLLELIHFGIEELEKATDKFSESRILGKGGLGTVYKGMLSDGRIVAVKKANLIADSQVGQFINEVFILSQINHRHIVKLLGCCLETEVPLLVYEYVSNGTLSHHLHDEPNSSTFSWENRLRIAAEVAGALAYLHSFASTAIFHRDIKSSNILLDEKYKAVVSDFGLSRSVPTDKTHLTTMVGGTFGYLDPEYFRSGHLNDKSDVYAFGVVLAEILTGQKAVSSIEDDKGLAGRFRSALKENCLFEILDRVVAYEGQENEILAVAKLAKRCLKMNARKRPSMKEAAAEIDQLRRTRELPGRQESFHDNHCCLSESCYSGAIYSEAEDDQTMS